MIVEKQQDRTLFLFNDLLLYCKAQIFKKTTYTYKGSIPLNVALVVDIPDSQELLNCIQIVRLDDDKRKYLLVAPNAFEKKLWMNDLNKIIEAYLAQEKELDKRKSNRKTLPPFLSGE